MNKEKGFTVTFISWDDSKPRVAGRFKTGEDLNMFIDSIHKSDSGWLDEELQTITIHEDYNYMLPY